MQTSPLRPMAASAPAKPGGRTPAEDARTAPPGELEQQILEISSRLLRLADAVGAPIRPREVAPASSAAQLAGLARAEYKHRRRRERVLDTPDIFADPAWDILLDLFAARLEGKAISTSSACIAACVPGTTALRWLASLESGGLIQKLADDRDRRRTYVEITDRGMERMTRYFAGHSD